MKKRSSDVPAQWMLASNADEIDLRELTLELWRQKVLILLMTTVFGLGGVCYALLARQVWTSQGLITQPTMQQIDVLQLGIDQLRNSVVAFNKESAVQAMDFSTLSRPELYTSFINAFNSLDNKRAFLKVEGIYDREAKRAGINDQRAERALMKALADGITAKAVDKLSQDMILSFSAERSDEAKQLLMSYVDFVQARQVQLKNAELHSIWQNRIKTLEAEYLSTKADTMQNRQDEIARTKYSLRISQAAGVDKPLENLNSQEMFNIELGSKGLAEKLRILQEMKDPEMINPALAKLRLQLNTLKGMKIEQAQFQSYNYLDSPEEPVSRDKPKRPLVVVLSTLLGAMLGGGVVLVRFAFRQRDSA